MCSKKESRLVFLKREINFPEAMVGEKYDFYFVLENLGNKTILIKNVVGDCNCLNLKWPTKGINKGKYDTISGVIKIDEKGFFKKEIMVYANTDSTFYPLILTGYGKEK
jgi:hypothetical protein